MRNPTYLTCSRHGVFYFRWPIPASRHPTGVRSDLKLSLGTRQPVVALLLARLLAFAGPQITAGAARTMRYDEMRRHVLEHFQAHLDQFRERVAERGLPNDHEQDILRTSHGLAGEPTDTFYATVERDGGKALLAAFLERRGITETLAPNDEARLLAELQSGYRSYLGTALELIGSGGQYDYSPSGVAGSAIDSPAVQLAGIAVHFSDAVDRYLDEGKRGMGWVAKTYEEKRSSLLLHGELIDRRPLGELTKADARDVKAALMRLPKNRSKMVATRDLPLKEALAVANVDVISTQTVNG
jgi:hypothetical protein